MQFVAPFLINFGINKAMGMSTGKALGMAGINSFLPGGGATSEGAGGLGGLLFQGGGSAQQLALEGGKTLASGMAAKNYGLGGGLAAYGGLSGLQGAAGFGAEGLSGLEGAKAAIVGAPQTPMVPPMKPEGLGMGTTNLTGQEMAKKSIQEGVPLSKPLEDSGLFPPMVVKMVAVGERSGKLEFMLGKIAQFYEEQTDAVISGLASIIEPLLIVFLGFVVGSIVIALFLPIIQISEIVAHSA